MQWAVTLAVLAFVCCVKVPRALHRYFVAEFLAVLSYFVILRFRTEYSPLYVADFILMESLVLVMVFGLAWEVLRDYSHKAIVLDLALALALFPTAAATWSRKLGLYDWIAVAEGFLYLFASIPTGLAAAQAKGKAKRMALSLLALWMAQSAWEYGFTLHLWQPDWMRINEWFSLLLGSGGSLWLAWGWGDERG